MPVHVRVDSSIRIALEDLPEAAADDLRGAFTHANPDFSKRAAMRKSTYGTPRYIASWRKDNDDLVLPRGGLGRVREVLARHGVARRVVDNRTEGRGGTDIHDHRVELYPFQREFVDQCIAKEQCIGKAPTGAGKTTMAMAMVARLKLPTLVIVPTVELWNQWQTRAVAELGMAPDDVGSWRGGKRKLRPLTIAVQKTVATQVDREAAEFFGAVICDEAQFFAAKTFYACVEPFPARYRIAVSADHTRKDKKEFLVHDLFGDVAADVPRAQLIASGHVLDVEIRVIPTDFRADWYGGKGADDFDFNRLLDEMAADDRRTDLALDAIHGEVQAGRQVLVFTHRREFCRVLDHRLLADRGVRAGFLIGGDDYAQEFARTRAGIVDGSTRVGIGTFKAIGTGIDLPAIGVGVVATPVGSNRQFFGQVRGRLCRTSAGTGKSAACMYYLWDRHVRGFDKHLQNLLAWNDRVVVRHKGCWTDARKHTRRLQRTG